MHKAKCKSCGEVIVSERPGHFVDCKCGESFIDTSRWFPEHYRLGGEAEYITEEESSNENTTDIPQRPIRVSRKP